jgi:hypothetical protein
MASSVSARTQVGLLGAEILTLALFAVVAFAKVAAGDAGPDSVTPELSWFNRFAISSLDGVRTACSWRCSSTGAGTARCA